MELKVEVQKNIWCYIYLFKGNSLKPENIHYI